tara:strand:- start:1903 stop:2163 length:261 start_codon:yes stop_codon:yes gene_type:complete
MIDLIKKAKRIRERSDKRDKHIVLHYKKIKDDFDKIVSSGLEGKKSKIKIVKDLEASNVPPLNGKKWTSKDVDEIIETLVLYKMLK